MLKADMEKEIERLEAELLELKRLHEAARMKVMNSDGDLRDVIKQRDSLRTRLCNVGTAVSVAMAVKYPEEPNPCGRGRLYDGVETHTLGDNDETLNFLRHLHFLATN